ncbi:hypothetical protein [Kutzneria kofuensis]|uniref:hypothetical protein n=1 Tax=Kutzneria kofuensis TaxID=103725 RepID=UPI0031EAB226
MPEKIGQMLHLDARGGVRELIDDFHVGAILHTSPENLVLAMDWRARPGWASRC